MGFEGEFASYEPLRRILESEKVKALESRLRLRDSESDSEEIEDELIRLSDVTLSGIQPEWVLAIDGSYHAARIKNGFPGAEIGYITVASVLINLELVKRLETNEFISPKEFRKTEKAATIESVFPGCNVILDNETSSKASLRKAIFEELANTSLYPEGETLLETYEVLLRTKLADSSSQNAKSPIEDFEDKDMTYGYGEYTCPHSGAPLYSTDALRLHELMNNSGSSGELYGQIMSTLEKLWLVHIIRAFEQKNWLATLRRVAFVMDGPLAVFSTSSWLTKSISSELERLNELQRRVNGLDILMVGIEKSGAFQNHFIEIDTTEDGISDKFPAQSAFLVNDSYIKRNIIFSESQKPYGLDTYFGRKFFYKTSSGHKLVPVVACFNDRQRDIRTANIDQFSRLGDVMKLLDSLVSSRYPDSISPLVSAHAEAAIPLNIGKRIFEEIARELRGS